MPGIVCGIVGVGITVGFVWNGWDALGTIIPILAGVVLGVVGVVIFGYSIVLAGRQFRFEATPNSLTVYRSDLLSEKSWHWKSRRIAIRSDLQERHTCQRTLFVSASRAR